MGHLRQYFHQGINFIFRIHFGHSDQHVIFERRIILAEIISAQDAVLEQMCVDFRHRFRAMKCKLVEERRR